MWCGARLLSFHRGIRRVSGGTTRIGIAPWRLGDGAARSEYRDRSIVYDKDHDIKWKRAMESRFRNL